MNCGLCIILLVTATEKEYPNMRKGNKVFSPIRRHDPALVENDHSDIGGAGDLALNGIG